MRFAVVCALLKRSKRTRAMHVAFFAVSHSTFVCALRPAKIVQGLHNDIVDVAGRAL
jgi:hypothetical protein